MKKEQNWEIKDRNYYLTNNYSPLTYTLTSKHSRRFPLLWFDSSTNTQRELRYASNQNSPFIDEQKGMATLEHVIFKNGTLFVPKENQSLQKLLSIYHPLKNGKYKELDVVEDANNDLDYLDAEFEAQSSCRQLDVEHAEAILRTEIGSKVSEMSSNEIKRDIVLFAKRNPYLFLSLVNDENVELRNFEIIYRAHWNPN